MRRLHLLLISLLVLSVACDPEPGELNDGEEGPHALPELDFSKADNYIGTNAREFVVFGDGEIDLPAEYLSIQGDEEAQAEIVDRSVADRMTLISQSVRRHIQSVVSEHNRTLEPHQVEFFTYFRPDEASLQIEVDEVTETIQFSFELELVGNVYLMSLVAPDDVTHRVFDVDIYSSQWGGSVIDTMELGMRGSTSRDAFPRYDELFEDGVLDIAIHFGGDYNSGRYDLETARWTVESLLDGGWENEEVRSFEDLRIDSPPFTRHVFVEGNDVEVQIRLFHAEMKDDLIQGEAAGHAALRAAVEESLKFADIFVYSGHAGTDAGFILDYSPRYEIRATELADMEMSDNYQIFVMDGCNTYRTYVRDIMANPNRDFGNTDIMTTVHTTPFSAGYHVIWRLMYWFTFTDNRGNHFPLSWQTMIRDLNRDFPEVHYGVHGVDDGPKLNPHASEDIMCQPCWNDSQCGAGGNYCLGFADGGGCGVACTTDAACGQGYRCARIFDIDDQFYMPKQCVPRSLDCSN